MLTIGYEEAQGVATKRVIWPLFITCMEDVRIILAWCETRQDFRHFRTDRVRSLDALAENTPSGGRF